MFKSKYIIVKSGSSTIPVIFGDDAVHKDVARAFMPAKIVGAGFCYIADDQYHCYGESTSLQIKSNGEEDAKLLNTFLGVDYQ
jgi:hypothetical protein